MNVLESLDHARAAINVLEHPFYRRWIAGDLAAGELACYAGEYRHAVVALAAACDRAAAHADREHARELADHAAEEHAHIELWEQFARAAGAPLRAGAAGRAPLAQTRECVRAWTAGESLLEHLAVLYAIEAGQPDVSATKLDGLTCHYGYGPEGPAVEYFSLHAQRDVEHARQSRELIARLLGGGDDEGRLERRMVSRARDALRGNWRLLDGVQARSPHAHA